MRCVVRGFVCLSAWLCAWPATAVGSPPREVPSVAAPPVVDGVLHEAAWEDALVVDDFVTRLPVEGAVPSRRTEVRLMCTERALYVGVRASDPLASAIRATSLRRDDFAIQGDDQFVIAIDSFRDLRNGYWFSTNPLGVRVDAQFWDEGDRFDDNWDGVWAVAARRDDGGWTAELEIPWATMRFHEAPEVEMGITLFRRIPHTGERMFCPAIPLSLPNGTPNVSAARPYRFRGIAGGARLDLRPFALASRDGARPGGRRDGLDGGAFLRVPVTSAVTLSGTVHADFSEVEADQPQLNLSRYPLFLPEKRDFFLEGAGRFAFGVPGEAEMFFSRTLGLAADATGGLRTSAIAWGLKAVGQTGPFEFGALSGATGEIDGSSGDRFDVARLRALLGGRSTAGAFWSRRDGPLARDHQTFGVDASHFLPREIRVQGFGAFDRHRGGDAGAWYGAVSRGGERATFQLSALDLAPGFEPAVGLVARPGTRRLQAAGTWPWFRAVGSRFRRHVPGLAWVRDDGAAGDRMERSVVSLANEWKSDHVVKMELVHERERLAAPFAIYRDVVIAPGAYERREAALVAHTDPLRPTRVELEFRGGGLYGGHHRLARAAAQWTPSRHLVLAQSVDADRVTLPGARFTAWVLHARAGLTLSPALRVDVLGRVESEREGAGVGVRARYDFGEGTRLDLAWDSVELRAPGSVRARSERAVFKASYLLLF